MNLGIKNDEVMIVPYNHAWREEFLRVQLEIQTVLNFKSDTIEHIGSTAIEGIKAKPIIDMLLGLTNIDNLDPFIEKQLRTIGFYRLRVNRPNEIIFAKFEDSTFEVKTHFIHAVIYKGELWENLLFFRNYLNEHEAEKFAYEQIKEAYLFQNKAATIKDYTNFKESFVKRIIKQKQK